MAGQMSLPNTIQTPTISGVYPLTDGRVQRFRWVDKQLIGDPPQASVAALEIAEAVELAPFDAFVEHMEPSELVCSADLEWVIYAAEQYCKHYAGPWEAGREALAAIKNARA
jgi:hypothetical protein